MSFELADDLVNPADAPRKRHVRTLLLWIVSAYWIALFVGTHLPPRDVPNVGVHNDKLLHFGAYLGLAGLFCTLLWARGWATSRILVVVVPLLVGYGAIDEVLQIFVGRTADVWDWVADTAGVAIGCLGFVLLRNTLERLFRDPVAEESA